MKVSLVYRGRYHVREALDLETLAAVLREGGHRVNLVYDPDTFGVTDNVFQVPRLAKWLNRDDRTLARLEACRPDVIVFSVLSSTYAWCRRIATEAKRRTSARVVFAGLHPSLVPERVMQDACVDFTICGETEGVIHSLLDAVKQGGGLERVGNLWFRRGERVLQTRRAPLVDLDALPLPDKELFSPYVSHRYSYSAMVSRGCPYQCTFCEETCCKKLYGGTYFRRKSVDTVMRELAAGKSRYHFREVIFKDSYLSGNKRWLCELLARYRNEIRVPFKCFCTIAGFDDETAGLLKQGGCYSIEFGLQTWNDRLRREVLNRQETSSDAFRVFELCDRLGLRYDVDHMFHLPTETEEDHITGAECYGKLRCLGRVKVHYLVYYPTADILNEAIAEGHLPADARRQLAEGNETDFYDPSGREGRTGSLIGGYATLYRVLPLLPAELVRWLVRRGRVRYLRRLPSLVTALLQSLIALRCGDLRFAAYLRTYPRKVLHSLLGTEPRGAWRTES